MSHPDQDDDRVDAATRRLLSSPPPLDALRWVERAAGGRVLATVPLTGGMSSAVHLVTVEVGRARRQLVLRRYVRSDVTSEEPDIAEREVRTLRLLERLELATPAVLAFDAVGGAEADVPTILMTVVPGAANAVDHGEPAWTQIAEAARTINRADIGTADGVQPFSGYAPRRDVPPPWMADPSLWDRAVGVFHGSVSDEDTVFLHRDFHTGNVLWQDGKLSGVVDWQAASIGPASIDIGYMRFDLLDRYGPAAGAAFLRIAADVTGRPHDPWADVILLVDGLGGASDLPPRHHAALEAILARVLAELGTSR